MDRKSIIILVVCAALLVSMQWLTKKWYPDVVVPVRTNQVANVTSTTNPPNNPNVSNTGVTTTGSTASTAPSNFVVGTNAPEQTLVLTNNDARYTFTSRGGGLKEVELIGFPETVMRRRQVGGHPTNAWATLNAPNLPPVFALLGDPSLQGDSIYKLTPISKGVRAEKSMPNGLTIVKDFQLSTNFLITASIKLENHTHQTITIPSYQWAAGSSTPMSPQDNGLAQSVQWFNGSKAETVSVSTFDTNTSRFFGLMPRTPIKEYVAGSSNVAWVSPQNQFFALAVMPEKPADSLTVHMTELPAPTAEDLKETPNAARNPRALEAALNYPGLRLAPGAVATNSFNVFAGPKEYQTLAMLAARFNNEIDRVMNFGWFGAISKALLVTMNWIHRAILLPYGWTIVFITIVLKAIFWPLTQASTRSAKRMQELQPQLKALQEKYKDDPQKLPTKQWEFYKKNNINPAAGCLPALLQMPVFLGFYYMLRTAIELRGAPFLWIGDLSKPDTIFYLPGINFPVNPLPLFMGLTQLIQARMVPMSTGADPQQQKMMKYMPLFFLVFMYNLSSGLVLYWTVSNVLTIIQTKLTRTSAATTTAAVPVKPVNVAPQKKKKD